MSKTILKVATWLMILYSSAAYASGQQVSQFNDLEEYLQQQMVGPEAIRVIADHLNQSRTSAPLENLVAWAKAGFPDLHDEHGIWKTESLSLRLGVVRSLYHYLSALPSPGKSKRYLAVIDELQSDDYIIWHLVDMAYQVVDADTLEEKVKSLLEDKDPKMRSQGILLGRSLAEQKLGLFERYAQMLKNDDDAHVRTTILYAIIGWRRRDVALIAFERLLNDANAEVKDWAYKGVRSAAEHRILFLDDLVTILPPLMKTNDAVVRVSIARTAARLATLDRSLMVRTDKITEDLVGGFIKTVRAREATTGSAVSDAELAKLWVEWWTPLIPEYTVRPQVVH